MRNCGTFAGVNLQSMGSIFLIGYMGSGKTSVGKRLARKLGLQFIDMDCFIENRYRKTVSQLFAEKGEDEFREIERNVLTEISGFENVVVATGGGLPCFYDNMDRMNASGLTVYLKVSEKELAERLNANKRNRPLIKDKNKEEIQRFIAETLARREFFYNQASVIFETERLSTRSDVADTTAHLILRMEKWTGRDGARPQYVKN